MSLWKKNLIIMIGLLGVAQAQAGIVVGGTRVVYDASKREASLSISNPDKSKPYLIQSWFDNVDDNDKSQVPFIITPPLFRLDAGQENIVRIVRVGGAIPDDKESAYIVNVKSIPSSDPHAVNQLQITVNTRIKMFYRPAKLPGNADEAFKELKFSSAQGKLQARNDTPYYISFYSLKINGREIAEPGMIAPKSTRQWHENAVANGKVSWSAINDFGGISSVAEAGI
ncbi:MULTISPECIES: fimbrial biogenesis chaperone [Gibbsiella]|uniref:Molecular chaperone n=1 Tax=Gibbsiella dentisursi TaxID=796890 RepID=A0ABP7LG96_9GAMM|nr:molecular chaperone [Gibbsiella quercinecans]